MNFLTEYRRSYFSKDEYKLRMSIFAKNLKTIEERNRNEDGVVHGIT